ncbi:acetoin dehydrogenase dihydrolipoyllysine-residue acetyltransferase subunit [Hoeflea sp. TYP-13]|uniref:acetoin dehydrogenase dihydrolipoyllysine-residue acetyltransferase subunit n=1 Tax=Hoeflea sp. TYP-13 TaxID=3230023 RepID=UPI0034C6A4F5
MTTDIEPIVMPKWGLAMTEGLLTSWLVDEGVELKPGTEIAEIETTKIANVFETPIEGKLRKLVATEGETLPVGALLAVIADDEVSNENIEAYVTTFQENFVPEETGEEAGPEPETVSVGEHRISYLKVGEGEGDPVLLIHGFGADTTGWMFNQTALADGRPVYALDLPGHGRSSKFVGDGSVTALSKAVSGFTAALGLKNVHLVGHSLGGAIAIAAATEVGAKSLTVIDPAGLGTDINIGFLQGFIDGKRGKQLKPVLEQLVADKSLISRDMINEVIKFKRVDGVLAGLQAIVDSNFAGGVQSIDLRATVKDLAIPVSVIWGREDEIIPVSQAEGIGDSTGVTVIDGAGHIPQMEKASEVNDIILATIGA